MTTYQLDTILTQQEDLLKANVARCMQLLQAAQKSGQGIGVATGELTKAQRALAKFQADAAKETGGGRFTTLVEAVRWVIEQGYLVKERSAHDHIKAGVPRQKDGTWLQKQVEEYAQRTWENPSRTVEAVQDGDGGHKARLLKANADLMELKVLEKQGNLLDAAEEEARDAAVLLAIRRHLELFGPELLKAIINDLAGMVPDEIRTQMLQRLPEWNEGYQERVAEVFDQMAQAGGVA